MKLNKELLDQSLHFIAGFAATVALSFFIPILWAAGGVMFFAVIREKLQHRSKKIWQLGKGSLIDLLFWSLGIGLALGLKLSGVL